MMARRQPAIVIDLSSGSDEEADPISVPTTDIRTGQVRPQTGSQARARAGLPSASQTRPLPEQRTTRPAFESKRAAQLFRPRVSSESSDDDVQEISSAQFPLRKTKDGPSNGVLGRDNRGTAVSAFASGAPNKDKDENVAAKLALFHASKEAKRNPPLLSSNHGKTWTSTSHGNKSEEDRTRDQPSHSAAPSDDTSTPRVRIGLKERVRLAKAATVAARQQGISLPSRATFNKDIQQSQSSHQKFPAFRTFSEESLPKHGEQSLSRATRVPLPPYGTFSEDVGGLLRHQKESFTQTRDKRKAPNDDHPSSSVDAIKRARLLRTSSTVSSSSTDDLRVPHSTINPSVVMPRSRVTTAAQSIDSQRPNIPEPIKQAAQLPKTPSQSLKACIRSSNPSATDPVHPRPYAPKGQTFTPADDELLIYLKEVESLSWAKLTEYFPGRTWAGLQTRYSQKFSKGARARAQQRGINMANYQTPGKYKKLPEDVDVVKVVETDSTAEGIRPQRRLTRKSGLSGPPPLQVNEVVEEIRHSTLDELRQVLHQLHQPAFKHTYSRNLRHRELGLPGPRAHTTVINSSIKAFGHGTLGPVRYMLDASGDVSTVAWSPDGKFFAAGAVAVTDPDSMQYNKSRNLVIGDGARGEVKELPNHQIPRPIVYKGDNASESMRNSQDDRIYTTVQSVAFANTSKGTRMYSVSYDHCLNVYILDGDRLENSRLTGKSLHKAPIDLLAVSKSGLVATGCRISDRGSINVFPRGSKLGGPLPLSAGNVKPSMNKFPSALRFDHHHNLLLAGFSCEANRRYEEDDSRDKDGEVCLWDLTTGDRLEIGGAMNRNVFDLNWNPNPGRGSTSFAVACGASGKVNYGTHSVVRLYAPSTATRANHVVELECPAYDINDVIYSPYDDNIITAGSTDGKVYVWDIRQVQRNQSPLRVLEHANSLSVLPHQLQRWEADTGIRFLSWGADHSRLYSGSSDGVVKCWDPYRSDEDKHVRDVVKLKSAVMSGAFSPDNCSLLVGEDASRLNLLSVGNNDKDLKDMIPFKIQGEPEKAAPKKAEPFHDSRALIDSGKIVLRPMGAMPLRQAVQGPNYQERLPYKGSRLQEQAHQSYMARQAFIGNEHIESCSLNCGHHVSASAQEDVDALDYTGRFKDRIPHRLLNPIEPGLSALREGLNAKCLECGAVARAPDDDDETKALCEKCNFSCFRCQKPVRISRRTRIIECFGCKLSWRIGVLGYELIDDDSLSDDVVSKESRLVEVEVEPKVWDVGDGERERQLGSCT